jgi:hypothetical protein
MSYVIVYDRQVVKTPLGYSFLVLHGDNNVWEPLANGRERRARSWNCWALNQSEDEIRAYFQKWCEGEFQEHFRVSGRAEFVDDAGLMRWVENGLKAARTIEEFAKEHHCMRGYLWYYTDQRFYRREERHISTDDEYIAWVEAAREAKTELAKQGIDATENLCFGYDTEPLRMPRKVKPVPGDVVVRYGKSYYVGSTPSGHEACSDLKSAKIFASWEEAEVGSPLFFGRKKRTISSLANIKKAEEEKRYVIQFEWPYGRTEYVSKRVRNGWRTVSSARYAMRYDLRTAKRNLEKTAALSDKTIVTAIVELDGQGKVKEAHYE